MFASSLEACACSHHVEKIIVEADCHSHQTTEATQANGNESVCDKSCICAVGQLSVYVASKAPSKELKPIDEQAKPAKVLAETEFVAINGYTEPPSDFVKNVSYSSTLSSLLPARAPPRL